MGRWWRSYGVLINSVRKLGKAVIVEESYPRFQRNMVSNNASDDDLVSDKLQTLLRRNTKFENGDLRSKAGEFIKSKLAVRACHIHR